MSVLYAPRLSDRIVAGNPVVLFSIDPVAAVAKFKDPTASAAAALIPRRKYLAIVEMIVNVDWNKPPTRQPLAYKFHFAAPHVSEPASACLSLCPGPYLRAPILPSPPLPWSDCYVFTMNGFSARITAIHLTDPSPGNICTVTDAEMERIILAWVEDLEAQRAAAPPPPHEGDEGPSVPDSQGSSIVLGSDAGHSDISALLYDGAAVPAVSRAASSKASSSGSDSSGESDSGSTSSSEEEEDDFDIHFYGEIWLELTAQDELGTFDEWIDASDRLHEIKEAARRRAMLAELANQPETTKWAEDVASAGSADRAQAAELPGGYVGPSADDDNLVGPEDAIEHKFERETAAAVTEDNTEEPVVNRGLDGQQEHGQHVAEPTTSAQVALPPPAPPHRTRFRKVVHYFGKRLKRATTSVSGRVKNFSRRRSPK